MIVLGNGILLLVAMQAAAPQAAGPAVPPLEFADPATCQPTSRHTAFLEGLARPVEDGSFMVNEAGERTDGRQAVPMQIEYNEAGISFAVAVSQDVFGLRMVGASSTYWAGGDPAHLTWRFEAPVAEVRTTLIAAGFLAASEENLIGDEGGYGRYLWLYSDPENPSVTLLTCGAQ